MSHSETSSLRTIDGFLLVFCIFVGLSVQDCILNQNQFDHLEKIESLYSNRNQMYSGRKINHLYQYCQCKSSPEPNEFCRKVFRDYFDAHSSKDKIVKRNVQDDYILKSNEIAKFVVDVAKFYQTNNIFVINTNTSGDRNDVDDVNIYKYVALEDLNIKILDESEDNNEMLIKVNELLKLYNFSFRIFLVLGKVCSLFCIWNRIKTIFETGNKLIYLLN